MAEVIVWTNENGNVSVCTPTGEMSIADVKLHHTPPESLILQDSALPTQENDFFNAWRLRGRTVSVDIDAAKEITKDRLRAEREPLLVAQDVLFQRAMETGADTTAIVAEKNRLRDLTSLVDSCTTTAQLRALKAGN